VSVRSTLPFGDFLRGLSKALVFAVIIVAIGSYQGLNTRGGAAGVGKATTGAVVTAIILIFIFNFALSYILFRQNV
jgi:phospholipid/cholesterol/gamma-HCH transport system permease protein